MYNAAGRSENSRAGFIHAPLPSANRAEPDKRHLIGRRGKLIIPGGMFVPCPLVEIRNSPGFPGKWQIPGKYPGTMPPRMNDVFHYELECYVYFPSVYLSFHTFCPPS
jgi:hypothetical protein